MANSNTTRVLRNTPELMTSSSIRIPSIVLTSFHPDLNMATGARSVRTTFHTQPERAVSELGVRRRGAPNASIRNSCCRPLDSSHVLRDESQPEAAPLFSLRPREEITRDLDRLIEERKLFGAELNPTVIKKSGKGTRFLISKVPSRPKLLRLWANLFRNVVSPSSLLEALAATTHEFQHRENALFFGKDRIIYDTQIFQGDEGVGELTLTFGSIAGPTLGILAYLRGSRLRVVYIEHMRVTAQKSGYASTLFRHYEQLFRDLGFNQFRLSAALSVGRYYWAPEGFDFSDRSEIGRRKAELRTVVKERGLPVREVEIGRLNHAYDFARFRRELKIPVYRDADGSYSSKADARFREE